MFKYILLFGAIFGATIFFKKKTNKNIGYRDKTIKNTRRYHK